MAAEDGNHHRAATNGNSSNFPPDSSGGGRGGGEVIGSAAMRPVFLGNLVAGYTGEDISAIFERPMLPPHLRDRNYAPVPVDRIDLKRGYCFVFLKDAASQADKEQAERFVSDINGMDVPNVSRALRSEFARGDGRIKRKEDERRRKIAPSETLFVVNFHEQTTRKEDLQMLFEPFGELVRIDMKRNYAFVQFRTIEEATKAKDVTNGGKLDQSVLTVEYVARQRGDGSLPPSRGFGDRGGPDRYRDSRDRFGYDDRRGPAPPSGRGGGGPPPSHDRDRYDRGGGFGERRYGGGSRRDDRMDDGFRYPRERSPPGGGYRGRPRSRSRSRSPPQSRYGQRSRGSPPRGDRRYEDRDRYDDYRDRRGGSPTDYRDRGRSPERDNHRFDRERGYRP